MAIICERCGTRTSSMICTECGYINPDPNVSKAAEEKKEEALSFDSATKLVRKWRWTNFFGYFHTISLFFFWLNAAIIGIAAAGDLIMTVIVSAFVKPENHPVLYQLFGIDANSIFPFFPLAYYILPVIFIVVIMYLIFGLFGLSLSRNIACVGFSFFLKKKNVSLRASFAGEDLSRSGMMLQDAMVMKERPISILAFFGRTFGIYTLLPVVGTCLSVLIYFLFNAIYLIQLDAKILTNIIIIVACIVVAVIFAIPVIVIKKVMEVVFENKIYKQ